MKRPVLPPTPGLAEEARPIGEPSRTNRRLTAEHYAGVFDAALEAICLTDAKSGVILDCNPAFVCLSGYEKAELLGQAKTMLRLSAADTPVGAAVPRAVRLARIVTKTGHVKEVEFKEQRDVCGTQPIALEFFRDVTAERQTERDREATLALSRLLNDSVPTPELIHRLTDFFQDWSGCEAVGIRLREGDDFPYFETRGFSREFVLAENRLCQWRADGQLARDQTGHPLLECMCGNVLCGRFDPRQQFFTARGSFWSNSTTELLASTTAAERQTRTRNRCNGEGYESVALIPIRQGAEVLGLLQLNDRARGRFTAESLAFLEEVTEQIGIALAQRYAQAALAASEQRFKDITEVASEFIWEIDTAGRLESISERVTEILEYRPADLCGRTVFEFMPSEEADRGRQILAEHLRTGRTLLNEEVLFFAASGRRVWLSVSGVPVRDATGFLRSYRGAARQVTAHKQLEERRGKEAERADLLLKLYEKSPQLRERALYDYVLEQAVRITDSEIGFFHLVSDDQQSVALTTWNHTALEHCTAIYESHYPLAQAGNWVDCVRLKRPIVYNDFATSPNQRGLPAGHAALRRFMSVPVVEAGKVCIIFGVGNKSDPYDEHDVLHVQLVANELQKIMRQRRHEENLRQMQAQVARMARLSTVGEMTAGIAHEINKPLYSIVNYAKACANVLRQPQPNRDDLAEWNREIATSATRAGAIMKRLMEFLRAAEPKLTPENLRKIVDEAIELTGLKPTSLGVVLENRCAPTMPPVRVDRVQIQQVLLNLLCNACEALQRSPAAARRATVDCALSGRFVEVSVTDSGPGLGDIETSRLFTPFVTTKAGGLGMGLSICKTIIESHGGQICAVANAAGATFHFTLPWGELDGNDARQADSLRGG